MVVVNAWGDVLGAELGDSLFGEAGTVPATAPFGMQNTTVSVVLTNARLSRRMLSARERATPHRPIDPPGALPVRRRRGRRARHRRTDRGRQPGAAPRGRRRRGRCRDPRRRRAMTGSGRSVRRSAVDAAPRSVMQTALAVSARAVAVAPVLKMALSRLNPLPIFRPLPFSQEPLPLVLYIFRSPFAFTTPIRSTRLSPFRSPGDMKLLNAVQPVPILASDRLVPAAPAVAVVEPQLRPESVRPISDWCPSPSHEPGVRTVLNLPQPVPIWVPFGLSQPPEPLLLYSTSLPSAVRPHQVGQAVADPVVRDHDVGERVPATTDLQRRAGRKNPVPSLR